MKEEPRKEVRKGADIYQKEADPFCFYLKNASECTNA
jgi:hypothetical protein